MKKSGISQCFSFVLESKEEKKTAAILIAFDRMGQKMILQPFSIDLSISAKQNAWPT